MVKRRAGRPAAVVVVLLTVLTLVGCSDDDSTSGAPASTAIADTTTTSANGSDANVVTAIVTAFAERQVGMVDPVMGDVVIEDGEPARATVEVRTRREGGGADDTLTPTIVSLVADGGTWKITTATSPDLVIESPPSGMRLSAGFVTPSGRATAFEGTVVVQALLGPDVLGEAVTTAEGTQDAPWAARIQTGVEATGEGWILAYTTAGTDNGPPVFALVPVVYGDA
jgi:hypothetical protein